MKEWFVPELLALLISTGFIALFALSLPTVQRAERAPIARHAPAKPPQTDPAQPDPAPAASPLPRPSPGATAAHVDALRRQCVQDTRSGKAMSKDPHSACQAFARASRASLPTPRPAPPMPAPAGASDQPSRATAPSTYYAPVFVEDCRRFPRGSIDHRRCRSREAERLRTACREHNYLANLAQAKEEVARHRAFARSYCREADRYSVLD